MVSLVLHEVGASSPSSFGFFVFRWVQLEVTSLMWPFLSSLFEGLGTPPFVATTCFATLALPTSCVVF